MSILFDGFKTMANWPKPKFSRGAVDQAGEALAIGASDAQTAEAEEIISNWRACHAYPINTFQKTLRDRCRKFASESIVAQRLKRTPSIIEKLRRYPDMKLSRMQDIGGLRAVVPTVAEAHGLFSSYAEGTGRLKHVLVNQKDYVLEPKHTGYRGYHLVWKYAGLSERAYDGLRLEMQIRTRVQHAWATAVETAGTFLKQSLKSSEGDNEWLDFFSLLGSGFAMQEGTPVGNRWGSASPSMIINSIIECDKRLKVIDTLSAFQITTKHASRIKSKGYFLVRLDVERRITEIKWFDQKLLSLATQEYLECEREIDKGRITQAVLVSTTSLAQLERAYPNYFLDTSLFLAYLNDLIVNPPY